MIFEIGIYHYTLLSAFLFFTGVFGIFLNRTNLIIILMSLELNMSSKDIIIIIYFVRFKKMQTTRVRDRHAVTGG
mgnify:CR=1 FL=1